MSAPITYSIADSAERIGCGPRWLADECRAGRIEHCKFGQSRRLTQAQIELVIASRTEKPVTRQHIPPSRRRSA